MAAHGGEGTARCLGQVQHSSRNRQRCGGLDALQAVGSMAGVRWCGREEHRLSMLDAVS